MHGLDYLYGKLYGPSSKSAHPVMLVIVGVYITKQAIVIFHYGFASSSLYNF